MYKFKKLKGKANKMIENPTIGIIGGTGLMGRLFADFFKRHGYKVLIAGRRTPLSMENCAKESDILVFSVSMEVTEQTIKKYAPLVKKEGLVLDLTSLKSNPLKAMLEYSKCSVVGTHPVFGPGVKNFKKQTIVICPGRGEAWQNWLIDLFKKDEAKIKITSATEHDKMMGIIQGLIHFTTITVGHALKELGVDIEESRNFSSPIYKLRLDMIGRILNQNPSLYANIEILNPETTGILEKYIESCEKLFNMVKSKDFEGFNTFFSEAADYLGDFKEEAENYSNFLINKLVDKT